MSNEKLFVISGSGNDSVGLVKKITTPIADINGNIVDLRQDVLHGLFTIYLVVDLSNAKISTIDELQKIIGDIENTTDLELHVNKYSPIPRDPDKKNFLLILVGYDKPGISAKVSETLSKYKINIEFSQMIARENVFVMELLTDISHSTIPVSNLEKTLKETMLKLEINTLFQSKDVFNKKKRVIIFDLQKSFISTETAKEIIQKTSLENEYKKTYSGKDMKSSLKNAIEKLDGLPLEVFENIIKRMEITSDTIELLQTLKIMGYKIVILTPAFQVFLDVLKNELNISHCYGSQIIINEDSKSLSKELNIDTIYPYSEEKIIGKILEIEKVEKEDITFISDNKLSDNQLIGIKINFDIKIILEYFNQHILNNDYIIGLLGCFGIPRK